MKTAVSVPDEIFNEAERFARKSGKSRSEVFSKALQEYLSRHASDAITEAMNAVCAKVGKQEDSLAKMAARRILRRSEW